VITLAKPDCPYFEKCNAPLCPLDEESLIHGVWYPEEEICRKMDYAWIKKQKKIKKLWEQGKISSDFFFTVRMLNSLRRIKPGLKGANPDRADGEKEWLRKRIKDAPAISKTCL